MEREKDSVHEEQEHDEVVGTPGTPEAAHACESRSVLILNSVLGLFATREVGLESEREVKSRHDLNRVVHRMLILGLVFCTVTLFIGLALSAIYHHPLPAKVLPFREIFKGLKTGSPPSFLSLGILMLIATPVLRVFGSLVEFVVKRDWRYACITLTVILILGVSVFIGR